MTIAKCMLIVCAFSSYGCASTPDDPVERTRMPSPEEAASVLNCADDEIAICIQTNCELEDYACASREDARKLFKAGDFQYD